MTGRAALAVAVLVCGVSPARAQPAAPPDPPRRVEFLSRTDFLLSGEHLSSADRRYVWAASIGAEVDAADYRHGRVTLVAAYEVVLGEELRAFDPNQGNYVLGGSASVRRGAFEVAGVFHHESRHLADRAKRDPVDWNMVGARLAHRLARPGLRVASQVDARGVVLKSYVDYGWEIDARARLDASISPRVALLAAAAVRRLGVDGTRNRGGLSGFRGEAGVSLAGRTGAVELFAAFERRIDPYPLEFSTADWFTAGFRVVTW